MKKIIFSTLGLAVALAASSAFSAEPAAKPPAMDPSEMIAKAQNKMFEDNDTNKDGVISKSEWAARGEKMFDDMDANKDGKITLEEMKAQRAMKNAEYQKRQAEGAPPVKQ